MHHLVCKNTISGKPTYAAQEYAQSRKTEMIYSQKRNHEINPFLDYRRQLASLGADFKKI